MNQEMSTKIQAAKGRLMAKQFIQTIPSGMAIKMPEKDLAYLDNQPQSFVAAYFKKLKEKARIQMHPKFGVLWEKTE